MPKQAQDDVDDADYGLARVPITPESIFQLLFCPDYPSDVELGTVNPAIFLNTPNTLTNSSGYLYIGYDPDKGPACFSCEHLSLCLAEDSTECFFHLLDSSNKLSIFPILSKNA